MRESIITKVVSSFRDREHLREEIPVRMIMAEINETRKILRSGSEMVLNQDTMLMESVPIGETRLKELQQLWNIDKVLLQMVIPSLKPIGVTVKLPSLSKEDREPHNIRSKMLEHVLDGELVPDTADVICKVAGAIEDTSADDAEPTSFNVNLNLVDAKVQRDVNGIIIETEDDDMGDAFNPVSD